MKKGYYSMNKIDFDKYLYELKNNVNTLHFF